MFGNLLARDLKFTRIELHVPEFGFIVETDMKQQIYVTLQIAGIHRWPDAGRLSKNHKYLEYMHRHNFNIKVTMPVTHSDRDIEFLELKDRVYLTLSEYYWCNEIKTQFDFGTDSCEQIAINLLTSLNADQVEVSEDCENGAIIYK